LPLCLLYQILFSFHFVRVVIWANTIRILFHPFPMKSHPMPFLIWCILTFVDPCNFFLYGGANYCISFIDDYLRYTYVYHFLKNQRLLLCFKHIKSC
jgi:hypothetical protein